MGFARVCTNKDPFPLTDGIEVGHEFTEDDASSMSSSGIVVDNNLPNSKDNIRYFNDFNRIFSDLILDLQGAVQK